MKRQYIIAAVIFLFVGMASRVVTAHHGTAAYDMTKLITVKGMVTQFAWSNPHAEIHLDVKNDSGAVQAWVVETNSPNVLARAGWSKSTFKLGDVITVLGYRAKDGSLIMRLGAPAGKVVLPDGKELLPDSY